MATTAGTVADRSRAYVILGCAGGAAATMGLYAVSPALPVIGEHWGLSAAQIGLYNSLYLLPGLFVSLPLGVLGDVIGRRTSFTAAGVLFGLAGILQAFATSFELLLGLRMLQGVGLAWLMPLTITLIGDAARGAKQVSAQAYRQVTLAASDLVWPLLGVATVSLYWAGPLFLHAYAVAIGIAGWFVLDSKRVSARGAGYLAAMRECLADRVMMLLLGSGFFRFLLKFAVVTYIPLLVVNVMGGSLWQGGATLSMAAGASALAATQARRLLRGRSGSVLIVAATAVMGGTILLLGLAPSIELVMLAAVVYGLADGVFGVVQISYVATNAPESIRGGVIGLSGMLRNWGKFAGPAAISLVALVSTFSVGFVVIGAFTLAAAPLLRSLKGLDAEFAEGASPP